MQGNNLIHCVVPTSPIPSHPSTELIEKTLDSIRFHLPDILITVMADGIRPQVAHRVEQYEEYKRRLADLIDSGRFGNTNLRIFPCYTQQAKMMRTVLNEIRCVPPLTLFVEHDTLLVTDTNPKDGQQHTDPEDTVIDWTAITCVLLAKDLNQIRFYYWEKIWHEHVHLMTGIGANLEYYGCSFIGTTQYSQWPNIARTDFYQRILKQYFKPNDIQMIELPMYAPVSNSRWEDFKIGIYAPGQNYRRFYHLNGRADSTGRQDEAGW